MNHPAPTQKAARTATPSACFQRGAPDGAISSNPVPQNAITTTL